MSPTHSGHLANQYQRTLNTLPSTVAEPRHNIPAVHLHFQPLPGTPPKKVGTSRSPTQTCTICEYYRAELQLPTTMQEHFIVSAVDNTFQEIPPRKYLRGECCDITVQVLTPPPPVTTCHNLITRACQHTSEQRAQGTIHHISRRSLFVTGDSCHHNKSSSCQMVPCLHTKCRHRYEQSGFTLV